MSRIEVMGCPVDTFDMQETVARVESCIAERSPCQHVVVNVSKFVEMQQNPSLKNIIEECNIINADGMPMVWAARMLGLPLRERVAGVDLFQELIRVCAEKGYRPFFFGAREEVVKQVAAVFKKAYPSLEIAGYRNGYFNRQEERKIADEIRSTRADMLFVGFSSPMKEEFLSKWKNHMQVPFCMGVGGSFDVVAGRTRRAPVWMQKSGLEWAYRIYQEPHRMWKRYAKTNPVFLWILFKNLVSGNQK